MGKLVENIKLGNLKHFIVHSIGNKCNGNGVKFSEKESTYYEIEDYIIGIFSNNLKYESVFQFYFEPYLYLNPIYQMVSAIFEDNACFLEQTKNIGKYLYEKSNHPKINDGELCISYFEKCYFNNEMCDAIAFFKSEDKDTVLKVDANRDCINLTDQKGISIHKIKKGCIVFNIDSENGYIVLLTQAMDRQTDSIYWFQDFLHIKQIDSDFNKTNYFLNEFKKHILPNVEKLKNISKQEKISVVNNTIDYFSKNTMFNLNDFKKEVLCNENIINLFNKHESEVFKNKPVDFLISNDAFIKQKRKFKSIVKLDKNFHIYVHGGNELIEKGVDEDGRKYYKFYYDDEI